MLGVLEHMTVQRSNKELNEMPPDRSGLRWIHVCSQMCNVWPQLSGGRVQQVSITVL